MRILLLKREASCPGILTLQGNRRLGGGGGVREAQTGPQERPFLLEPANYGMGAPNTAPLPLLTSFGLGLTPHPSQPLSSSLLAPSVWP